MIDTAPMSETGQGTAALEDLLDGAAMLGIELDPRLRVLAVTLEPTLKRFPGDGDGDRRVQLLGRPVSTFLASPGTWGTRLSLAGRSTASDGRGLTATFSRRPTTCGSGCS